MHHHIAHRITYGKGIHPQICASLYSWVNDGSHSAYDDCYVSPSEAQVGNYLSVFKRIFEVTNHAGHYDMMIGYDAEETLIAEVGKVAVTPG